MRTLVLRLLVASLAVLVLPFAGTSAATAATSGSGADTQRAGATAQRGTPDQCERGSSSSSGRCYKYLSSDWKVSIVEAVPMQNRSSKRAKFTCTFSRSITKSVEAGISVGYEAKGSLFKLVEVGSKIDLSFKVSQSAQQATSAGVSVTLDPGESVNCLRTYGHVVARVQQYSYSGSKIHSKRTFTTKVPAKLGIRIVD